MSIKNNVNMKYLTQNNQILGSKKVFDSLFIKLDFILDGFEYIEKLREGQDVTLFESRMP